MRHVYSRLSVFVVLCVLLGMVNSVSAAPRGLTHTGSRDTEKHLTIVLSMPYLSPFYANMQKQIQDEAQKLGNIDVIVLYSNNAADQQAQGLESILDQKIDGLLISPVDVE